MRRTPSARQGSFEILGGGAGDESHQAEEMGANAIVNVRFATSSVAQGAAELFAYGTAVTVG